MPEQGSFPIEYCGKSHYSREEQHNESIMDEFAIAYLLPTSVLRKATTQQSSYLGSINTLSLKFSVPQTVAKKRLDNYLYATDGSDAN